MGWFDENAPTGISDPNPPLLGDEMSYQPPRPGGFTGGQMPVSPDQINAQWLNYGGPRR